ncbi:MAG: cytochrome c1 [Rhodospirillales bacterium]|jgi:cytochrome c1|nr:cytochrome c1 [Rhodospirillales bacterium]
MLRNVLIPAALAFGLASAPALASGGAHLDKQSWSWDGLFGAYDKAQMKRGFQIFHEVCSNCHGLKLVAYRNLKEIGLSEDEAKAVAGEREVKDGPNDEGEMFNRPGKLSDRYIPPFANDQAARVSNNGALPPDLSLITKARAGGPDYVYSLLMGFEDAPADYKLNDGMNYNKIFPGNQIGMAPQISDDLVTYADGTKATSHQLTMDVVAFLNWAAEPELDERKSMGLKTLIFLLVLTGLFYALKRKIWADVH